MAYSRKGSWALGTLLAMMLAESREASAIPAFARKYQTSCSTCHLAYPTLNSFGKAFRAHGYRMPGGDEALIERRARQLRCTRPETLVARLLVAVGHSRQLGGGFLAEFSIPSQQ